MNVARPVVAGGTGATSAAAALVNLGLTATAAEINILDGATVTTAELNVLDGIPGTLTATEIGYLDGVTSAIQTQLNAKQATITTLALANGGTGAALVDPNADRLLFWDDSAGATAFLTPGTGLTITGTTITAEAGRVLLATRTASASATLDFTEFNNAVYSRYEFEIEDLLPATNTTGLWMRFSTNGGSTYDSTSGDYSWISEDFAQGGYTSAASPTDVIGLIRSAASNTSGTGGLTGNISLINAASASARTKVFGHGTYLNTSPLISVFRFAGQRTTAQDTDAVRFLWSSGNHASGRIRMYGVV